jgi:hypothetical protein
MELLRFAVFKDRASGLRESRPGLDRLVNYPALKGQAWR